MNESNNQSCSANQKLAQLSIEALEKLLISADEGDDAYINQISDEIIRREMRESTGRMQDTDEAWMEFKEHYAEAPEECIKDLTRGMQDHDTQTVIRRTKRSFGPAWRRTLGATAIVCIVFISANVMTVSALDMNIFEAIGTWTSEIFQFAGQEGDVTRFSNYDDTALRGMLQARGIEEPLLPTRLPEGFSLVSSEESSTEAWTTLYASYGKGGAFLSISIQILESPSSTIYEKDGADVTVYHAGGIDHYILHNLDGISIAWKNTRYECAIVADISIEEAKEVIDSIYM